MKYLTIKKPYINKKYIQTIKDKLKKEGWEPITNGNIELAWGLYLPNVICYDKKSGENCIYSYNDFIETKYNNNPTKRRLIFAKEFIFDRLILNKKE